MNVVDLKAGGMGRLGDEQLEWLEDDLAGRSASTPIVVFAHIPLWSVYPEWGWGTEDSAQALGYLKRFGSVTVLNGHIHQVLQKVEGTVTFHTAMSTAFPQPKPGEAKSPGPMKVPAEPAAAGPGHQRHRLQPAGRHAGDRRPAAGAVVSGRLPVRAKAAAILLAAFVHHAASAAACRR